MLLYSMSKPHQMRKLIEVKTGPGTILVETDDIKLPSEVIKAGGRVEKNIDKMLERLQPFCESIINNFQKLTLKPTTASAEFGLNFTFEGNVFVVKASAEATVKVTLNWTLDLKYGANS